MDFASLMSKTLSKSTTPTPAPAKSASPTPVDPKASSKFISRREAEEARRAAYLAEQQRIETERAQKAAAKRKREEDLAEEAKAREEKRRRLAEESRQRREERETQEEKARRKRLGLPEVPVSESREGTSRSEDDDDQDAPSEDEVQTKLRAMGEPVVLFGETAAGRLKRFRRLTGALAQGNGPIATTLVPVEEKDMKVPDAVPQVDDKKARKYLYRQLASYFNMVLREWERALAKEGHHDTTAGKQAVSAMLSSKESMKAVRVYPWLILS